MKSKEQLRADFQNGTLDEAEHRAYLLAQVKGPSDKAGAGMVARALDAAGKTIPTADAAFLDGFLNGTYLDAKGKTIQPTGQQQLNGAKAFFQKSVTDIGYRDPQTGNLIAPVLAELSTALDTAELRVGKSKEQLRADFQNGRLDEAEHRAYLLAQVKGPSEKAGAGMVARALDAAGKTIPTADAAFLDGFLNGTYLDAKGKTIQPTGQQHLNGAKAFFQKSVTDIGYRDPQTGNLIAPVLAELSTALDTAELRVGKSKEQLRADFQNGRLDEAEHRAYLLAQVKGSADKTGAGMVARALDAAGKTIPTADAAFLDGFLNGTYLDAKGKTIQPTGQQQLNGAKAFFQKSVTDIGYRDPQTGNLIAPVLAELSTALDTAELRVRKSKEQLRADFQNGTLDEAEHRAYLLAQLKGPSDKAGAGMVARALDAAGKTIPTADAAFLDGFLNGTYLDAKGKTIQPTVQRQLNGAKAFFQKSVTDIGYRDPQTGNLIAPVLAELSTALDTAELRVGKSKEQLRADFQNGTLDEAEHRAYLLAQVKGSADKTGAGMVARALDAAGKTIPTADAAFLDGFLNGTYLDAKGKTIQPTGQRQLNGAKAFFQKSVTDIGYRDPQTGNLIAPVLAELSTALDTAELRVGKSKEQLRADFQNGTLDEAEHRAYLLAQLKGPSEKAGAGMVARALDAAGKTIPTADAAFLDGFLNGTYLDAKGKTIQPTGQRQLNGAKAFFQKSVTDIGYRDPQTGNLIAPVLAELSTALDTAELRVGKSKEQLRADFQNGTLDEAEHRAYLLAQLKGPSEKAGAGMVARALDAAGKTIPTADAAFLDGFLNGTYLDAKGKTIQPTGQQQLNGAKAFFQKSVTDIGYRDPQTGNLIAPVLAELSTALDTAELRVGKSKEQLRADFQNGRLDEAEHRAYLLAQVKGASEKAGAGMVARALDAAGKTIPTADAAFLDGFLNGTYLDAKGKTIQPTGQRQLNGAKAFFQKSVTDIGYRDPQTGNLIAPVLAELSTALDTAELRVGKSKEQLRADFQNGRLDEAEHRAYLLAQLKGSADKTGAGMVARALDAAGKTIPTADAAFLDGFLNGTYLDAKGKTIQPTGQRQLNGAKAFFQKSVAPLQPSLSGALKKAKLRITTSGLESPSGSSVIQAPGDPQEPTYDELFAGRLHEQLNPELDAHGNHHDTFGQPGSSTGAGTRAATQSFGAAGSSRSWDATGYGEPGPSSASAGFMSYPQTIAPDSPRTGAVQPPFGSTSHLPGPPESAPGLDDWRGPSGSVFSAVTGSNPPSSLGKRRERDGDGDQEPRRQPPNPALSSLGLNTLGLGGTVQPEQGSDFEFRTSEPGVPVPYVGQTAQTRMDLFRRLLASGVEQTHAVPYAPPHEPPPGWDQHGTPLPASSAHSGISPSIYATPGSHVAYPHSQEVSEISGRLYPLAGDGGTHPFQGAGFDGSVNVGSFQIPEAVLAQQTPAVQQADASLLAGAYHGTYPLSHAQGRGPSSQGPQPGGGWSR